jgi:tetratricopeptide (TPR) repeat protein
VLYLWSGIYLWKVGWLSYSVPFTYLVLTNPARNPNPKPPLTGIPSVWNKDALYYKGEVLFDLGNYTGAILYYDKALAIDPKYVDALNNKGFALDNLGNDVEAILYYDKDLATQPNDTYALNNKGAALNNLGNYTGAILYYNKALAIDPKNSFALTNKDAILHMLGNNSTYSTYQNSDNSFLRTGV